MNSELRAGRKRLVMVDQPGVAPGPAKQAGSRCRTPADFDMNVSCNE